MTVRRRELGGARESGLSRALTRALRLSDGRTEPTSSAPDGGWGALRLSRSSQPGFEEFGDPPAKCLGRRRLSVTPAKEQTRKRLSKKRRRDQKDDEITLFVPRRHIVRRCRLVFLIAAGFSPTSSCPHTFARCLQRVCDGPDALLIANQLVFECEECHDPRMTAIAEKLRQPVEDGSYPFGAGHPSAQRFEHLALHVVDSLAHDGLDELLAGTEMVEDGWMRNPDGSRDLLEP